MEKMMLFSQRYSDFIDVGHGESIDNICGEIKLRTSERIWALLMSFNEPKKLRLNRYTNEEIEIDAFRLAVERFNDILGYALIDLRSLSLSYHESPANQLAGMFLPYLFDVIELQYVTLSKREAHKFQGELNMLFNDENVPWLLCDGRMIKIDAQQFEAEMKAKAIKQLGTLKDCEPKFQAAFDELQKACEAYTKEEYVNAILNAEKSYESIMKVICDVTKGTADNLCQTFLDAYKCDLPEQMKPEGFKNAVLLSLPFIRNNTSAGHGAGANTPIVSKTIANLAVNLASALNTFLIEEYSAPKYDI